MRRMILFLSGLIFLCSGCTQAEPKEKAVTIVNTGAISPELQERVRAFAEKELHVRVRSETNTALADLSNFKTLEKAATEARDPADVSYIVLAELAVEDHLKVHAKSGVAMVNARPLKTDDTEVFERRIERMVMRAAAFSFGLAPTPDPFCVTRDYSSLEDLDRMGRNFSPPWQARYADEAAKRGLEPPPSKSAGFPGRK